MCFRGRALAPHSLRSGRVYRYVLVDLTACTFLDSMMINALLAAAKGHVARTAR